MATAGEEGGGADDRGRRSLKCFTEIARKVEEGKRASGRKSEEGVGGGKRDFASLSGGVVRDEEHTRARAFARAYFPPDAARPPPTRTREAEEAEDGFGTRVCLGFARQTGKAAGIKSPLPLLRILVRWIHARLGGISRHKEGAEKEENGGYEIAP